VRSIGRSIAGPILLPAGRFGKTGVAQPLLGACLAANSDDRGPLRIEIGNDLTDHMFFGLAPKADMLMGALASVDASSRRWVRFCKFCWTEEILLNSEGTR